MFFKSNYFILGLLLVISVNVTAQKQELGNVSLEELELKTDSIFPKATAIVLSRMVKVTIGRQVIVYEKIKILNEEGVKFGNLTAEYYDISNVKGTSYNLVDGQIITTPLTKDMTTSQKDPFGNSLTSIRFPEVQKGTVIEYSYQSNTGITSDVIMQDYLPIKRLEIEVYNRLNTTYSVVQNPLVKIAANRFKRNRSIVLIAKNIPPIEPVDYLYDMDLYSGKLRIRDMAGVIDYEQWEDVAKINLRDEIFSKQLRPSGIYKDELAALIEGESGALFKAKKVYDFIQNNIEWDQYYGTYPSRGTRLTFREKMGNVADINMLLVSALRSLDLESYVVFSSTKENGIPTDPIGDAFNYTLAGVTIGDSFYLLDAANKETAFGYLPDYAINGRGMALIDKDNYRWIDLERANQSTFKVFSQATIDSQGTIFGKTREQLTGYFALAFNNFLENEVTFSNEIVSYDYKDILVSSIKTDTLNTKDLATLSYGFRLDDAVEVTNDTMRVEPLLFLGLLENPFKEETRIFPIDYGHSQNREYLFTINYPENYRVEAIPEPVKIALPDNLGSYSYQTSIIENGLQVRMQLSLNTAVLPADIYAQLQEFYRIRVAKEKEKVVLVKRL